MSFLHLVELGDCRYAHMSLRGNKTDFSSFLGSTERIKPPPLFFLLLHTDTHTHTYTHTHTPSKSLARMTGDGQKQIMVIDRCLEMDLCVRVFMCVSEQRMGTEGSVQKLLIPSNREAMSLNQGQFRIVSPITNSPSPKHTHMQTVFALNNTPITKSDGRHIKPKCLLRREMNPSVWMKTLFYCDSMKVLHRKVNGSRQQSHPGKG